MRENNKVNYLVPLATLTTLFFMWGFITCMNDILIPYLKGVFQLSHFQSNLVQFAFFAAYFIISLIYFCISATVGDPIRKIGYKNMIGSGLMISATACFLFFVEAKSEEPEFLIFLSALFLLGTGFTFLQIAANPLVAQLGSAETSSSRLNLSQAFNSLGTTLAPVVGGYFVFKYFGENAQGASAVQIPYLILASVLFILAGIIFFAEIPNIETEGNDSDNDPIGALKHPNLIFGMFGIFCYVGGEVTIGSNLVSLMKEVHGMAELQASSLLSFYWGGAMIGRFMGSISMSGLEKTTKYGLMLLTGAAAFALIYNITGVEFKDTIYFILFLTLNFVVFIMAKSIPSRTLGMFAIVNMALILIMLNTQGAASLWTILSVGLFNSIMFSNVFTLGIRNLGRYTSQGSSLLVMMILGGAVVPPLQGLLADVLNPQLAFAVPLACYAYLAWYGFIGCKTKKNEQQN
ncbi:MAG: sugar MFS transporter [Paludibacteraceae bacterium]|nr:sugar MFS transporter [Paludibacteraceae bacterium]